MKIIIAGATGLIGEALVKRLAGKHELVIFTRDVPAARKKFYGAGIHFADWHQPPSHLAALIDGSQAMINLAGTGIGDSRWTVSRKESILGSRVQTVEALYKLLKAAEIKLDVIIQASAIGYYGFDNEKTFTEHANGGDGFLAEVSQKWENSATHLEEISERLVIIRSGVVMSRDGGALPKMALPFKFFAGGKVGSGKQWVSWIDIEDEVEAILFLLNSNASSGIYNLTAPNPVQQKDLAKAIGRALKRPSWIPVPAFALKLLLGKMAEELLLQGTKAIPQRLLEEGFKFHFEHIQDSMNENLR
ncbi:MAG: TIGR01777 family oxidoreductase [Bacteroidales bacterium]|nr:TIGR01777 family oxidoreductase [Bacteroidales bacterium]